MHSNTTSFVVNAFAPPHTQLKSQLKAIMGFSTSSQPQGEQLLGPNVAGAQMSPVLSSKGTQADPQTLWS